MNTCISNQIILKRKTRVKNRKRKRLLSEGPRIDRRFDEIVLEQELQSHKRPCCMSIRGCTYNTEQEVERGWRVRVFRDAQHTAAVWLRKENRGKGGE